MSATHHRSLWPLIIGGVIAAASATVFAASAPKTVDACVNAKGGLRVIRAAQRCPSGTTALSWNTRGARGPAGPAGASPAGYFTQAQNVSVQATAVPVLAGVAPPAGTTVNQLTLPAGSYLISATGQFVNGTTQQLAYVDCRLSASAAMVQGSFADKVQTHTVALQTAVTLADAGTVTYECASSPPGVLDVLSSMTAVQVGVLHTQ